MNQNLCAPFANCPAQPATLRMVLAQGGVGASGAHSPYETYASFALPGTATTLHPNAEILSA